MEGRQVSAVERVASATTYTAGGGAVLCGFGVNELAAIIGASVAVLTFWVNLWFKAQDLALAKARIKPEFNDEGEKP